jgi:hypothetical protein
MRPRAYAMRPPAYAMRPRAYAMRPRAYAMRPHAYAMRPRAYAMRREKSRRHSRARGNPFFRFKMDARFRGHDVENDRDAE